MNKLKFYVFTLFFLFLVINFTGCRDYDVNSTKSNASGNDTIIVYDGNDKMIAEFTEQKKIDYFATLIGTSVENIGNGNTVTLYKTIPDDAIVSYKYAMKHKKNNGDEDTVYFYVYKNYPYITLKGVSFIPSLTWELSAEDNNSLQNPKNEIMIQNATMQ